MSPDSFVTYVPGGSAPLLLYEPINQFTITDHIFIAFEATYFHVAIIKDINFDSLAYQGKCDENAIWSMPTKSEADIF